MISGHDFYNVMSAVVPLYVAMGAAYGSVRWWGLLTPEQCSGINRFVALFAVPLLSFQIISKNNPYDMNPYFVAADGLQKLLVLAVLTGWARWWRTKSGGLEWLITHFMVATLPNTLVMGIPLLRAMYGSHGDLVVQAVVLQCIVWYTLLLFLYEYRAAKALILDQFPGGTAASIVSFKVDSDVVSLAAPDAEAEAEVSDDGRIHVTVRRSSVSSASARFSTSAGVGLAQKAAQQLHRSPMASMLSSKAGTPRPSNLTGAEIYSLHSSRNLTPRESNFGRSDLYLIGGGAPRVSGGGDSPAALQLSRKMVPARASDYDARELHMFVWSSSASPTSERGGGGAGVAAGSGGAGGGVHVLGGSGDATVKETKLVVVADDQDSKEAFTFTGVERNGGGYDEAMMGPGLAKLGSSSTAELAPKAAMNGQGNGSGGEAELPPASVMTKLILDMVWRKLIRNPNTYSSVIGLVWALVSFRWGLKAPKIIEKSITILSDAGLGMAMFSLGLFMALQSRILACGTYMALFGMLLRFFCGPAIMSVTSIATGLRGLDLRASIVQAALPSGIVPFVFSKEYNVHPDVLSTAVIFGMLVALPITLVYYILLGI